MGGFGGGFGMGNWSYHHGAVQSVNFSSDGRMLVSTGRDSTIRIWDVNGGALPVSTMAGNGTLTFWDIDGDGLADNRWGDWSELNLPTFSFVPVTTTVSVPDGGTILLGGIRRLRSENAWGEVGMQQLIAAISLRVNPGGQKAAELMDRFDSLMDEGRYRYAEGFPVADLVLPIRSDGYFDYFEGEINRPFTNAGVGRETQSLRLMVTPRIIIQEEEEDPFAVDFDDDIDRPFQVFGRYDYGSMALRVARQRAVVDMLYQTELSHIPFPDEPIPYPDAEVWQTLTARRGEKYSSMSLASRSKAERTIIEALNSPTRLEFVDTPLEDVVDFLRDYHDIETQIDTRALGDVGLGTDLPITKDLKGISLRAALKLMLREFDLTYIIDNDVLLITTPEEIGSWPAGATYPGVAMRRMHADAYAQSLAYRLPEFQNNWNIYYDLLSYAPGMHTSRADVLAILKAELPSEPVAAGKIDARARKLIERARGTGWQTASFRSKKGEVLLSIDFDGTGRCRYERTTGRGLRELVLCDGTNLWHLYSELGIGGRRKLGRPHRGQLARLVPWVLPPVEELARGADLTAVDEHTVAVIPLGIEKVKDEDGKPWKYARAEMIFDRGGRLAERRLVAMPQRKTLLRQTLAADGAIRWLDGEGKELAKWNIDLKPCGAPELKPDARMVVLPMPMRAQEYPEPSGCENWSEEKALQRISGTLATNPWQATEIIMRRFFNRDDRRLGFYVLMIAHGETWKATDQRSIDNVRVMCDPSTDHPMEPLAKYVAGYLRLRQGDGQGQFGPIGGPRDGLLQQLAEFRNLWKLFESDRADARDATQKKAHRERVLKFIRRCKSPELGWALLSALRAKAGDEDGQRIVAEAAKTLENVPGLAYVARYERARATGKGGDRPQAQQLFEKLYRDTLEAGFLPPIDSDFRRGLENGSDGDKKWAPVIRRALEKLLANDARLAAIRLAWQVHHLGDPTLAEEVFKRAYGQQVNEKSLVATLAAVEYLWHSGQHARADRTLRPLLQNPRYARWPALWRLASTVAEKQGMTARALGYTERAMEIEYEHLPEMVNVRAVRHAYGGLLRSYGQLANTIATLHTEPPEELLGRVIRVADRWRSLDTDPTAACHAAAKIFGDLGAADLAWDYLTTPLAAKPNEAAPWQNLAKMLRQQAQFDLADRAYALAFEAEPQNVQILWDRAQVLLETGRRDRADHLLRRIADGDWQPEFNTLKSQARQRLQ